MAKATKPKLKIMVSSTVYGIKPLLKQVYDMLDGFGYELSLIHISEPTRPY